VLNIATTAAMLNERSAARAKSGEPTKPAETAGDHRPMPRTGIAVIVAAFIALQPANSAAVSIMSLFVTETLGLDVMWAGVALGVAAGLEIPALLLIGRLSYRFSKLRLIASGCAVGIAYYAAMVFVPGPVLLIGLQVLDAWFFAVVASVSRSSNKSSGAQDWPLACSSTRGAWAPSCLAQSSALAPRHRSDTAASSRPVPVSRHWRW
jgi:SET family sugar efflux transporter-like MFS transporter